MTTPAAKQRVMLMLTHTITQHAAVIGVDVAAESAAVRSAIDAGAYDKANALLAELATLVGYELQSG